MQGMLNFACLILALSQRASVGVQDMRTIEWDSKYKLVKIIDQRSLPGRLERIKVHDLQGMVDAIWNMTIRGAPALGIAAAFGMTLAALRSSTGDPDQLRHEINMAGVELHKIRPTAVNMQWAIRRIEAACKATGRSADELREIVLSEAQKMAEEDITINLRMAKFGSALIHDGDVIIHHCNTGSLAAVDWGTALGCIRMAHEQGKHVHVLVDETRPRLQGSRLTAWELKRYGIPFEIICDSAAGYFLRSGKVSKVMFGADRIAANGDVANKIGTYPLALTAWVNKVSTICVCPSSSVDLSIKTGDKIPIEERDPKEVLNLEIDQQRVSPKGARALNPAFDITPNQYVTFIVTEKGVVEPPFLKNLSKTLAAK